MREIFVTISAIILAIALFALGIAKYGAISVLTTTTTLLGIFTIAMIIWILLDN